MDAFILLLTFGWLAFWLLNYILNGRWWVWELWSAVPGWFWGASWIVLFIPSVVTQNVIAVISLLYTVPLWWPCLDLNLWPRQGRIKATGGIKLFNWNTEHWTETSNPDFFEFLKLQNADVYHLQEAWNKELIPYDAKSQLQPYFPDYTIVQSSELVSMTRLKVTNIKADPKKPFLRLDIEVGDKVVSFYNAHISVHFVPRYLKQSLWKFLSDTERRFALRVREYQMLDDELISNTNPFVLSGDFNTSTFMRKIRPLLRRFRDAYRSLKRGFATTWYGAFSLRWWRLDYVLGQEVHYLDYKIVDPGKRSDHWGQLVEVQPSK